MKRINVFLSVLMSAILFTACAGVPDLANTTAASSVPDEASVVSSVPEETSTPASPSPRTAVPDTDFGEYLELDVGDETTRVVVFGSDENSFQVASTLLIRNGNALLIDTKFTKTDAQEIIRYLNSQNLNLTHIFISHGDPDYYFGLEEFTAAFPSANVRTTPEVAVHIEATYQGKLETWAEVLGSEIPTNIVVPETLEGTSFSFEGLTIELFGAEPTRITLYIPELNLLVGGANITNWNHLFLADMYLAEDRTLWKNNLLELQALNAAIVIPGHMDLARETFDQQGINFSIEYLDAAAEILPTVATGQEFIATMAERFPDLNSGDVLGLSGGVLMGEMEWRRYVEN